MEDGREREREFKDGTQPPVVFLEILVQYGRCLVQLDKCLHVFVPSDAVCEQEQWGYSVRLGGWLMVWVVTM